MLNFLILFISYFLILLWLHSILWSSWSNTVVSRVFYFISVPVNRYKQAFLETSFFSHFFMVGEITGHKKMWMMFQWCASNVVYPIYIYIYRLISPMAKSLQISKLKIKNKDYYSSIVTTYIFIYMYSHIFFQI